MQSAENKHVFYNMLNACMYFGAESKPRGLKISELEDFQFAISPIMPFMTFKSRNYDVNYFKKEMIWKLGADRFDDSIKKHAKMWESVQNADGSFNSNYGQYWFGEQGGFMHVVTELARDKDSRQAVIPMLNASHMALDVKDKVCTFGVGFRIRDGFLNMSVQMRSSDQIYGLGTDLPTFSFLYRMVHGMLMATYPHLQIGKLTVSAMSSHIYERHYEMVHKILDDGVDSYVDTFMPWISGMPEALFLLSTKGKYTEVPDGFDLAKWLITEEIQPE